MVFTRESKASQQTSTTCDIIRTFDLDNIRHEYIFYLWNRAKKSRLILINNIAFQVTKFSQMKKKNQMTNDFDLKIIELIDLHQNLYYGMD